MATTRSGSRPARTPKSRGAKQAAAAQPGAAAEATATTFAATDDLRGAVPTWRMTSEEPIYLEVIRDLGVPSLLEVAAPAGDVIRGEVIRGEVVTEVHVSDV